MLFLPPVERGRDRLKLANLQKVALETHVPAINGVIVANSFEQARERCIGKIDRGAEFAAAALEMAALKRKFSR